MGLDAIVSALNAGGAVALAVGIGMLFATGIALFRREHVEIVKLKDAAIAREREAAAEARAQRDEWQRIAKAQTDLNEQHAADVERLATAVEAVAGVRVR